MAGDAPRAIAIEDLHWSDDATLEYVLHAIRRAPQAVLWLLTFRNDETHAELDRFRAETNRTRLALDLSVNRLTMAQVDQMIREIFDLGRAIRPEFLAPIFALTDGNPYFVEEALKALVTAGDIYESGDGWERKPMEQVRIPESVEIAVSARAQRLEPATLRTLTVAAVMGRRFDFGALQAITARDEETLIGHIRQLVAAQLVTEESPDVFVFRHALTREAIYATLLGREQKALHLAIARHIEATGGEAGDLSHHYFRAGAWLKASEWAWRAGERARQLHVPQAALEHDDRALIGLDRLGADTHPDGWTRGALLRARGQAREQVGDFDGARADDEAALAEAERIHDASSKWQAMIDLGALWASREYARAGEYFEQALALARVSGSPHELARSLIQVGNLLTNTGRPHLALDMQREALVIFEGARNAVAITCTLDLTGQTTQFAGNSFEAKEIYDEVIRRLRDAGDLVGLSSAVSMLQVVTGMASFDTMVAADDPSMQEPAECLSVATRCGSQPALAFALFSFASRQALVGAYAESLENARRSLTVAETIGHRQWTCGALLTIGVIYLNLLEADAAIRLLVKARELASLLKSNMWEFHTASWLARSHLAKGDIARAGEAVGSLPGFDLDPARAPATMAERQLLATQAEYCLATGDIQ
ncbi:MAG: tetratricopeptide repeat protein, partial [Thermoflexales bacterium]